MFPLLRRINSKAILLLLTISILLLLIGLTLLFSSTQNNKTSEDVKSNEPESQQSNETIEEDVTKVTWRLTENGWENGLSLPKCPDPLNLSSPVNLENVTSILYPGQVRGSYKPHGGFRFDNNQNNQVRVVAPATATVVSGARYIQEGEIQYYFDFITDCGVMYRLDHLSVLSEKFQKVAEQFPEPKENDSRGTLIESQFQIMENELIATSVGFEKQKNVFLDFGVYNIKQKNEASKNVEWAAMHSNYLEQRGLCWFDLLKPEDEAIVRSLSAGDQVSGKKSDYCLIT